MWNRVQIRVRLNRPGCADGIAGLGVNGHYREFDKMVWRSHPDTRITEVGREGGGEGAGVAGIPPAVAGMDGCPPCM